MNKEKTKQDQLDSTHAPTVSLEAGGSEAYELDSTQTRKLLRKLDLTFNPVFMLVYLTCFLDRSNIGNVKVAGIIPDIHTTTASFSTAVSIFYATYILIEVPTTLIMKLVTPRILLSGLCIVWSLTTLFTGLIQGVAGLYVARLVLGLCEGGLMPCLNLYLSMVYNRNELGTRTAYLFSCAALSGAFGGLLAYGLLQMDGVSGFAGWRWVFIIEGLMSIVIVPVIWFGLPSNPSNAWFLNDTEKEMMRVRDAQRAEYMGNGSFDWKEVKMAFRDPKVYLSGMIQFCQDILLYGFSTFLPSILTSMGYNKLEANYLTIPVYIWGAIIFVAVAHISDKYQVRGAAIFLTNTLGIAGYILLLTVQTGGVRYFATFLCVSAVYVGPGLNLAWLNANTAPHYKRAAAIGIQQSIGNSAGIVSGQIYRTAPYVLGNSMSLGALGVAEILIAGMVLYLRKENRAKEETLMGLGSEVVRPEGRVGDEALDFKYHL
ncbi:MFS general substrate transporter [Aspergillus pseudoustus]|uniref:MFS general substrate transporter n=1 Tax=Aspergillus pseudoustus TaxID=1810923 RepID=A0ABR4IQV0_9EURO